MVETAAHFQVTRFSNQVDIEQTGSATADRLYNLLEHAESVMGKKFLCPYSSNCMYRR